MYMQIMCSRIVDQMRRHKYIYKVMFNTLPLGTWPRYRDMLPRYRKAPRLPQAEKHRGTEPAPQQLAKKEATSGSA